MGPLLSQPDRPRWTLTRAGASGVLEDYDCEMLLGTSLAATRKADPPGLRGCSELPRLQLEKAQAGTSMASPVTTRSLFCRVNACGDRNSLGGADCDSAPPWWASFGRGALKLSLEDELALECCLALAHGCFDNATSRHHAHCQSSN